MDRGHVIEELQIVIRQSTAPVASSSSPVSEACVTSAFREGLIADRTVHGTVVPSWCHQALAVVGVAIRPGMTSTWPPF